MVNTVTGMPEELITEGNRNVPNEQQVVKTWKKWSEYGGGHNWTYERLACGCEFGRPDDGYGGYSNDYCKEHAPHG